MKYSINSILKVFSSFKSKIKQSISLRSGWKGATVAISVIAILIFIIQSYYMVGYHGNIDVIITVIISLLALALISGLGTLLINLFKKLPNGYIWALLNAFALLVIGFLGYPSVMFTVIAIMLVILSLFGALGYKFIMGDYKNVVFKKKALLSVLSLITIMILGVGSYWLLNDGKEETFQANLKEYKNNIKYNNTNLDNPLETGEYKVNTINYRTPNRYREELDKDNTLITNSFDGSSFLEKWSSLRTKYLGFGPDKMPINGMVWYPEGEGPFPLVLVVHGAHLMADYSDSGYEYLGKHLASKGYIVASVDENFLNVSPFHDYFVFSTIKNENPARAVLLLQHLEAWKGWNEDKSSPFYGKVDINNIALMGHSRGGEAVAIAAKFNNLTSYPENNNIKFEYRFNIRSVVAISPTDGQYKPADKFIDLKDVNYLTLQGVHDMDVSSFAGAAQYERVTFTEGSSCFKSAVYIAGANHGQFNSSWGREDGVGMGNRFFNTKQLISKDEQEQVAKTLITSFLEATLKSKTEYKVLFEDLGYAKNWLPNTTYINNYSDGNTKIIASFEEDIDASTTTIIGGKVEAQGFRKWKEEKVNLKYGDGNYSVVNLEWDRRETDENPIYKIFITEEKLQIGESSSIAFSMADGDMKGDKGNNPHIDLTVQAVDKEGNVVELPLSHSNYLLPMIEGRILKKPFDKFSPTKEPVFQYFQFNLSDFNNANNSSNMKQLTEIRLIFNKTEKGTVLINGFGIKNK